ncbi:MAG: SIS domain-containing protein, partial [Anaerolineae bacterium]|nr:SIS domain-containing protein [Anaerolineae bacterium]
MENPLWADIQLQGQNLAHVVGRIFGEERANIDAAARFMRPDRPTVLIGVASAQYLCMPAEQYLNALGFPASTLCASDALYSHLPALRHSNVVINSRSGETAEVVKLGQALAEAGIPFVAITNEKDSSLARLAEQVVWVDTHKDDLVSINVVTGMMTATLALCAAQAGTLDALRPELERLPDGMVRCVAQAGEAAQSMAALFTGVRPIYLLYRGPSRGAAYCGRLALEEIARTP